ncbi:MAG: ribonuclease J [bacterium]|nr:ribonuclease J [bacterium]
MMIQKRFQRPVSAIKQPFAPGKQSNAAFKQNLMPTKQPVLRYPGHGTAAVRIIPLGGLEEVGRNMTAFEYGNDIIIIDMGLQFPEEDMPGIDYIIPDISYFKGKEKNIRGVIITHGHYDHIGAIPHLIRPLGNPPIFATPLTIGIIKKREDDYPDHVKLNLHTVTRNDKLDLGRFHIEFFHINHNIPDGIGIAIFTPVGLIMYTGDFKFDFSPVNDAPADIGRIAELGKRGVSLLMSDSTDAETPGHSVSEQTIMETLGRVFEKAQGRIIAVTFSSLISRIQHIITLAEQHGRKVALDGYSLKTNLEIAKQLSYVHVKKGTLIKIQDVNKYPNGQVVVIGTGAQGESNAMLMRIANHEHRSVNIQKGDTIIFSSSVVPGNERTVQGLKDTLCRQGAKIIHYKMMDVHAGGHAYREDLKMMMNLTHPNFFIPIHGNYYMRKVHSELAESTGIDPQNIIIPDNGSVVELTQKSIHLTKEKVPTDYIMVDGLGVGDVGEIVLRDRQAMAKDGIFTIIIIVDSKTKKIVGEPDIISRGFIYMKESTDLLNETKKKVRDIITIKTQGEGSINWAYVRNNLRDIIGEFLYTKTQRRPLVLPMIIEV